MEERMRAAESNLDLLNTTVAISEDRYVRIDSMVNEVRTDVKTLLDRTARLEGPTNGGHSKFKGFIGGLSAMLVGIAGFLIERR